MRCCSIINKPLTHQTQKQVRAGNGPLGATYTVQQSARVVAAQLAVVVGALERPGQRGERRDARFPSRCHAGARRAIAGLSAAPAGRQAR